MRSFKFRAWDKNIKVMRGWEDLKDIPQRAFWTAEDLEIMQFTGLLDKAGKEIYEGDIVKIKTGYGIYTAKVEFYKGGYSIYITTEGEQFGHLFHLPEDIEVIGNIYENPELLKSEL